MKRQVAESIKKYQEDKQIIEQFKELLAQVVAGLVGNKPFVIFIDELDFVLSIDKEQPGKSIKSQYGDINVGRYFGRFFDLTFELKF